MCHQINHVRFLEILDKKVDELQDTFVATWHMPRVLWGYHVVSLDHYHFRHWNFLICLINIGVMAILVEGYNSKIFLKSSLFRETQFPAFFVLDNYTPPIIQEIILNSSHNNNTWLVSTNQKPVFVTFCGTVHNSLNRHKVMLWHDTYWGNDREESWPVRGQLKLEL